MFRQVTGFFTKAKERVVQSTHTAKSAQVVANTAMIINAHIRAAFEELTNLGVDTVECYNSPKFDIKEDGKKYYSIITDLKLYVSHVFDPGKLRRYNLESFMLYEDLLETLKSQGAVEFPIKFKGNHVLNVDTELNEIAKMIKEERELVPI